MDKYLIETIMAQFPTDAKESMISVCIFFDPAALQLGLYYAWLITCVGTPANVCSRGCVAYLWYRHLGLAHVVTPVINKVSNKVNVMIRAIKDKMQNLRDWISGYEFIRRYLYQ
jgi:hypothetical protein